MFLKVKFILHISLTILLIENYHRLLNLKVNDIHSFIEKYLRDDDLTIVQYNKLILI